MDFKKKAKFTERSASKTGSLVHPGGMKPFSKSQYFYRSILIVFLLKTIINFQICFLFHKGSIHPWGT